MNAVTHHRLAWFLLLSFVSLTSLCAQKSVSPIPYLTKKGSATQLVVDNKPFLMIAGELHNSSSSTIEYMQSIWGKLNDCHMNPVLAALTWEQFDPQ